MDLTHYANRVEQAIGAAFVADKLSVHHVGGVQGPHTLTFGVRLYEPTKGNVAKALTLAGSIESHSGLSPVRIYTERGVIFVEVPSPNPVIVKGNTLRGKGLSVPLGMTSRTAITGLNFIDSPHLLLIGPTNAGKTTAARGIAYHLAKQNNTRQVRFIVSTFKNKDWKAFAGLAHTMAVIIDPAESASMIRWLVGVMFERTKKEIDTPHFFVFLDDLLNLLSIEDVSNELGQIASLGRGAGIHLIIGTQRLGDRGAGGSVITGNIPDRLVFGTASAQDASLFSGHGKTGAEKLGRYPGDAMLITDGGSKRLAVALVTDADLGTLERPTHPDATDHRPWLRTGRTGSENEGYKTAQNGPNSPLPVEPVLPVLLSDNSGSEPVLAGSRPVLTGEPRTGSEREMILQIYRRTGSKTKTCMETWGYKNGKTMAWLDNVLEDL